MAPLPGAKPHRSQTLVASASKSAVIGDEEGAIVDALNALRHRYT
jgi:hypothetical protein